MKAELKELVPFIKSLYPGETPVPLHAPRFLGKEKEYLVECIDSTFVSYVGPFVTRFEEQIRDLTGAKHAVAMVNGTSALQMALVSCGLEPGDEVITQALTFAATANGIRHAGGEPVFVDVDRDTLGMSSLALEKFLGTHGERRPAGTFNKTTGRRIFAVMPMHTFGLAMDVVEVARICKAWGIALIEDAAESVGTLVGKQHTGTFGLASILSFNGNKPITTGGGGMLITNDDHVAERARHVSTTAKRKHPWEFFHDELGWNLRMPNVNAALGCAQMDRIQSILANKRETAESYHQWGQEHGISFVREAEGTRANYWLNAMVVADREEREEFLAFSNSNGVQTRPIWVLMNKLPMYKDCFHGSLQESEWLGDRIINIPSSVRIA